MKKFYLILIVCTLIGCKTKSLHGTFYQLADNEKEISLDFNTDSTCIIRQNYLCNKLPQNYKNIEIECLYKIGRIKVEGFDENFKKNVKKKNVLFVKNKNCLIEDCKGLSNYTYITDYETLCGINLNKSFIDRQRDKKINTAVILNLINDTLQIQKKHIIFGYDLIPKIR